MNYFSRKIILIETRYKTHNRKLLIIVEIFKTLHHYLKECKYKVLVLTDYNNFCDFMDIKNLSFKQVRWAQKLSHYHFQIDYRQRKINVVANALSYHLQKSPVKEKDLKAENIQIFYCLQSLLINTSLLDLIFLNSGPSSNPLPLH